MTKTDFERFLLQGAISPEEEEEKNIYTGEFSFSSSKYFLFQYCRKAWYFHYILAQGGWDPYGEPLRRLAFREKYLLSFPRFLSLVLMDSIRKSLPVIREEKREEKREDIFLDAMKFQTSKILFLAHEFLRNDGMAKDPKFLSFSDLYYETGRFSDHEELMECAKDILRHFFVIFPETGFFHLLLQIPSPALLYGKEKFPFFFSDGMKIFLPPSLYALHQGSFYDFSISFSPPAQKETLQHQLFALYVKTKYEGHTGRKILLYPEEKEREEREKNFSPLPAEKEFIRTEGEKMMKALQNPVMENFPCTIDQQKCISCNFRGICRKTGK